MKQHILHHEAIRDSEIEERMDDKSSDPVVKQKVVVEKNKWYDDAAPVVQRKIDHHAA